MSEPEPGSSMTRGPADQLTGLPGCMGNVQGTKTIEDDGKVVKVQIWDTAGQERFRSLTANTIRGSHGAMFVYDITDRESYLAIRNVWLQELEAKSGSRQPVVRLLVGNKSDLAVKRAVPYQEAEVRRVHCGVLGTDRLKHSLPLVFNLMGHLLLSSLQTAVFVAG